MVEKDPDGHHGSRPGGHGRVHDHDVVVLNVVRKTQVVQLRLARLRVRLDQDLTDTHVLDFEKKPNGRRL